MKVILKTVEAELTATEMKRRNPHLRRKGLTAQEAVERGLKERIPAMYLNTTAFLAAIEGVGLSLDSMKRVKKAA